MDAILAPVRFAVEVHGRCHGAKPTTRGETARRARSRQDGALATRALREPRRSVSSCLAPTPSRGSSPHARGPSRTNRHHSSSYFVNSSSHCGDSSSSRHSFSQKGDHSISFTRNDATPRRGSSENRLDGSKNGVDSSWNCRATGAFCRRAVSFRRKNRTNRGPTSRNCGDSKKK
jgi:hypothetical protein